MQKTQSIGRVHNSVEARQAASCDATTVDFKVNSDGTVTDKITELMWKQCLEGLSGKLCEHGKPLIFTWNATKRHADKLNGKGGWAGYVDWRVPTRDQLFAILQKTCGRPTINSKIFPATKEWSWYWSSSPYVSDSSYAWDVNFARLGGSVANKKGAHGYIRLVRGGQ